MSTTQILIDRLRNGTNHKIDLRLSAEVLGPSEPELCFDGVVTVAGAAYLTDSHLIINLNAKTLVKMPCAVCNQMTAIELAAPNFYHAEPIENISSAVFDFSEALREALLIELPKTIECNKGKCPERESLQPFMRSQKRQEETYFPFANLDKKNNQE